MMILDKIIYQSTPPTDTKVLWYDGKTLRGLKNGNWKPIGVDEEMQDSISITINEDKSLSSDDIKSVVYTLSPLNLTFKLDSDTFLSPSFRTIERGFGPTMGLDIVKCSFFYDGVEHIYSWNYNSFNSSGGTLKEYKEVAYQPIEQA